MTAEVTGLRELDVALATAPDNLIRQVEQVTKRAAGNIRRDLRAEAPKSGRFRRIGESIGYDFRSDDEAVEVELGPEIGRAQGSLAFIAYEGTGTQGPSLPDPQGALDREAPTWEHWLGRAVSEVL